MSTVALRLPDAGARAQQSRTEDSPFTPSDQDVSCSPCDDRRQDATSDEPHGGLDRQSPDSYPTMIDLFSGCGGVTTGFASQRFKVLAAVECDPVVARTYRLNHPDVTLYEADIRNLSPEAMMEQMHIRRGRLTVLSVCAPCQPFSRQNRDRSTDARASLVLESLRFIRAFHPLFLFFENVPGIKDTAILSGLLDALRESGYRMVEPTVIDAVNYGVPQFRKRCLVLGTRLDRNLSIPEATHAPPHAAARLGREAWRTVKDAFAGLQDVHAGETSETDPLHRARKHTTLSLERLRAIPHNGGGRGDIPVHLRPNCHRKGGNVGYRDVYGRMDFNRPSNTLTTGCTNFTRGRFAHPTLDRSITLREAARLQTFPDSYQFYGGYEQISAQIGNAVPVKLAEAFARYFYEIWRDENER
jgi:DNA (cytosine-5)-methyltransferase 1